MRIAVIGAGIVGVSTAYELAADGHEVVVFERRASVAEEASFACAGLVAPGWFGPWTAHPRWGDLMRQFFGTSILPRSGKPTGVAAANWLWRSRGAGHSPNVESNRKRHHQLAQYSGRRLLALTQHEDLPFDHQSGCLILLRDAQDLSNSRAQLRAMAEMGVEFKLVDANGARALEPNLSAQTQLHAAVWLNQAFSANCRLLAQGLRTAAQRAGTRFLFQREVVEIVAGPQPVVCHRADIGSRLVGGSGSGSIDDSAELIRESFDGVVVCAAMGAPALLAALRLPMAPVHGYSITLQLRSDTDFRSASAALVDHRHQISITRHGQRLRLAGGAEVFGAHHRQRAATQRLMYQVLDDWQPGRADAVKSQSWKGARPSLPDGLPMLGASGAAGIWLNLGHGGSGLTLACGSARVVADLINRRSPDINIAGLEASRLQSR
jgi:D-amino-acid dehydrogenase